MTHLGQSFAEFLITLLFLILYLFKDFYTGIFNSFIFFICIILYNRFWLKSMKSIVFSFEILLSIYLSWLFTANVKEYYSEDEY